VVASLRVSRAATSPTWRRIEKNRPGRHWVTARPPAALDTRSGVDADLQGNNLPCYPWCAELPGPVIGADVQFQRRSSSARLRGGYRHGKMKKTFWAKFADEDVAAMSITWETYVAIVWRPGEVGARPAYARR